MCPARPCDNATVRAQTSSGADHPSQPAPPRCPGPNTHSTALALRRQGQAVAARSRFSTSPSRANLPDARRLGHLEAAGHRRWKPPGSTAEHGRQACGWAPPPRPSPGGGARLRPSPIASIADRPSVGTPPAAVGCCPTCSGHRGRPSLVAPSRASRSGTAVGRDGWAAWSGVAAGIAARRPLGRCWRPPGAAQPAPGRGARAIVGGATAGHRGSAPPPWPRPAEWFGGSSAGAQPPPSPPHQPTQMPVQAGLRLA